MNERKIDAPVHDDVATARLHELESEVALLRQDISSLRASLEDETEYDNAPILHDAELVAILEQVRARVVIARLAQAHTQYLRQRLLDASDD